MWKNKVGKLLLGMNTNRLDTYFNNLVLARLETRGGDAEVTQCKKFELRLAQPIEL